MEYFRDLAVRILGIALLGYGAIALIAYFTKEAGERNVFTLIIGVAAFFTKLKA